MNKAERLLFVYEPAQVPFVSPRADETVVVLDYEVELELTKRGIPFKSLANLAVSPQGDRALLEHTRALALQWYTAPDMAFFEHDGIRLGEQHEVMVLYYIQTLVYYVSVLEQVLAQFPNLTGISIFDTFVYTSSTVDPTGAFKQRLPVDVTKLLAARRNISCAVIPPPATQAAAGRLGALRVALEQHAARVLSSAWNFLVGFSGKKRPIVLFATDPWSRLEPFIGGMADVELIMSRRTEMRAMLPGVAWRTRARFNHRSDFVDAAVRTLARERAREFARQWDALGEPALAKQFVYKDISYWPVAKPLFEAIIKDRSEEAVAAIENTKRLFTRYGVNCVLLFASTKGYNNLVARVAERMGIPSIELQHALVNNEKTLVHCRLNSRYLASYGPLINHIYQSWGVEPWRLQQVGSPRFDQYAALVPAKELDVLAQRLGLDKGRCTVLWGMPEVYYSLEYGNYTSYDVKQILEDVADVQQKLSLQMLLRPRPGFRRAFYLPEISRLFSKDSQVVTYENLRALFALSDVVLTGTSTVVLEAMLMHKPVLMYLPKKLDADFKEFWESGAVLMARTKEELFAHMTHLADADNRATLVGRADVFVRENFLLDGGSSGRVAALVRRVAGRLPIEGERVRLEPLSRRHISAEYASWFSDPETTRYNRHGSGISEQELEMYVRKVEGSDAEAVFAVVAKEGNVHIGNISLQKIDPHTRSAEYAILMGNKDYQGRGFAAEASRLLLQWGFARLGLERVYCATPVQHESMRRLAKRLGFVERGVRKGAMVKNGEQWDVIDYDLHQKDLKI